MFEYYYNYYIIDDFELILNIVYFNYGLKNLLYNLGVGYFDFFSYFVVRLVIVFFKLDVVYFYYIYFFELFLLDFNVDLLINFWICWLLKDIMLIYYLFIFLFDYYVYVLDILCFKVFLIDGGIYFDIDVFVFCFFDYIFVNFLFYDVILGVEGGNCWGFCNVVIVVWFNLIFFIRWLEFYNNIDFFKEWNYYFVILLKEFVEEYLSEVCVLVFDVFFWLIWMWRYIDWMYERLDKEKVKYWEGEIERYGGSLFMN